MGVLKEPRIFEIEVIPGEPEDFARPEISEFRKKSWREKNKEKLQAYERARSLMRHYGITVEQFDDLLKSQEYKCACCGTDTPGKRGWHVDHDHTTKKIRGILCNVCNSSLGMNGDTLEKVQRTFELQIAYLRRVS